jgi:micrococcal nuclease
MDHREVRRMTAPAWTYRFRAKVVRVIDGDGLRLSVDCGLHLTYDMDVRLRGCNAAEKTTVSGQNAITYVAQWVANNADADGWLAVTTHKNQDDTYGRWLADVTSLDGSKSLALDLIAAGLAVAWDGRGEKPVPPEPPLVA